VSVITHLLTRAVDGIADEDPMAGYSDCPLKKKIIHLNVHAYIYRQY